MAGLRLDSAGVIKMKTLDDALLHLALADDDAEVEATAAPT